MSLTRYFMYKRIGEAFPKRLQGKILGISSLENLSFVIDEKYSEVILTEYPEVDIQNLPFPSKTFDYVISDQVLEHVEDPYKAIRESHKEGGIAIHTTCFINYFHPSPCDYWRFSPDALRFLCKDFTRIIQCEGWGNRFAALLSLVGDRVRNIQIPEKKLSIRNWLATKNESRYPLVTWIIAQK